MKSREELEHEKFHAELELMHEEAKPKVLGAIQKHRKYAIMSIAIGILLGIFQVSAIVLIEYTQPNPIFRILIVSAFGAGLVLNIKDTLATFGRLKEAAKMKSAFLELDLSMNKMHEEKPEEKEETDAKLKN